MTTGEYVVSYVLGLVGAVVGGVLGYFLFGWLVDQGFYGMIIPGALLGLGCGLLSRHDSRVRGLVCAAAAVALALFTEWKFFPFRADESFLYLVTHAAQILPVHLLMMALGAVIAYWLGKDGGFRGISPRKAPPPRLD
jgi:hypothetical protein